MKWKKSLLGLAEQRIFPLEDGLIQIPQSEEQRERQHEKNKGQKPGLGILRDYIKDIPTHKSLK